jgi:isoleucyl-tRNA synthetase
MKSTRRKGETIDWQAVRDRLAQAAAATEESHRQHVRVVRVIRHLDKPRDDECEADGQKCERCWHWETDVGAIPEHPTLCGRCVEAVRDCAVAERLPSITDQILSRSRLERIIREMNLYASERAREVMEDVVARMRRNVSVDVVGREADSFRVSYVSDNAETARKVTERLAALYIEQNLTDRNNQAESTSQFLEAQLEDAKRRLIRTEVLSVGTLDTSIAHPREVFRAATLASATADA